MNKLFFKKLVKDKVALLSIIIIVVIILAGIFAPYVSPNNPYEVNLNNKLLSFSLQYPLGTDHLGRCIASRLIYGIRTTVFYALFAMFVTVILAIIFALIATFSTSMKNIILRTCDVLLSFPSELMMLAIVGLIGTGIENIIIAAIISKVAWYIRMIYTFCINHMNKNFIYYSKISNISKITILRKHLLPLILSDIAMLASLNVGTIILSISALSFLGLGVQAPTCEWGIMLNEAKELMSINPYMMLPAGIMILIVVASFNFLGDCIRDALDPTYHLKIKDEG
ncbi:nickel ABC transporter permease subunit NikC [Malaciobacter molluscorum]|uniref:nickel/cobalt ABC transporter permease n=1 Tax=Malaciobacter molluscorum TaxID=1032072 RepID=UPI00100AB1D4|nr:nickel/cobalt ABC transporter permease [Malaciobacter molluscorum]RXJ94632.1 nickel ABC transporter permease subunit NikC [Malaciobacter molluscorum]